MSEWFSDLKMGYCSDAWWLNQAFCCWEMEGEEVDGCDSWHTWSTVTLARWTIFVLFAVSRKYHTCSSSRPQIRKDFFRLRSSPSRPFACKICSWFWHLRDQMYLGWLRHAGLPGICYFLHQKYDASEYNLNCSDSPC
jgi:hypothetical protein